MLTRWLTALLEMVVRPALAEADTKPRGLFGFLRRGFGPKKDDDEELDLTDDDVMLRYPAVERIVAIGDVHGDHDAFTRCLLAAGIINEDGDWAGGDTVLVQVGDQLDRGDEERTIYETLFRLQDTAPSHGGAVHILLGNHELMNVDLDFRYVTQGGFKDFERDGNTRAEKRKAARMSKPSRAMANVIKSLPTEQQARARALTPGGPLAVELARRAHIAVIVGDNVFVHGGLSPSHLTFGGRSEENALETLRSINIQCREFMKGIAERPMVLRGGKSPIWMRAYSRPDLKTGSDACHMLADTLKMIDVKRMIVGHTPQERGINAACQGRVWRIDTGMSRAYGGVPEAIEISKRGRIRILNVYEGPIQGSARFR